MEVRGLDRYPAPAPKKGILSKMSESPILRLGLGVWFLLFFLLFVCFGDLYYRFKANPNQPKIETPSSCLTRNRICVFSHNGLIT